MVMWSSTPTTQIHYTSLCPAEADPFIIGLPRVHEAYSSPESSLCPDPSLIRVWRRGCFSRRGRVILWTPRPGWSKIKKKSGMSPVVQGTAASLVLLSLKVASGRGRGCAGHRLVDLLHARAFFLYLHGAATCTSIADGVVIGTGGAIRHNVVHARVAVLPSVPAGATRHSSASWLGAVSCGSMRWIGGATCSVRLGK